MLGLRLRDASASRDSCESRDVISASRMQVKPALTFISFRWKAALETRPRHVLKVRRSIVQPCLCHCRIAMRVYKAGSQFRVSYLPMPALSLMLLAVALFMPLCSAAGALIVPLSLSQESPTGAQDSGTVVYITAYRFQQWQLQLSSLIPICRLQHRTCRQLHTLGDPCSVVYVTWLA
jgi:hypothetical protein